VFGFDSPAAIPLAEKCGIAFQLTNILRDIGEDAARGRIYLPAEDLERFGVSAEDLRAGRRTEGFLRLMQFEAARARDYYDQSARLTELVHPRSRPALFDVFSRRVSLPAVEKCWIVLRAWAA
jgi:phytoene synthase